jgi:vacuolar-type H+-ATPase subunit F/Vma7
MPQGSEYVYKGPWKTTETKSSKSKAMGPVEKLRKLKFRLDVCDFLQSKILKGEILIDDEKSLWMRYPTLTNVDSSEWSLSDVYDKIADQTVKVVDRSSLGLTSVAKMDEEEIQKILFEEDLYCDFLLLYILGVGDTGLYNVLRSDDAVHIIDIDDDTTKEEFSEICDVFARKPSGKIVKILEKGVKENKEKIEEYLEQLEEKTEAIVKIGEKNGVVVNEEEWKNRLENVKKIVLK